MAITKYTTTTGQKALFSVITGEKNPRVLRVAAKNAEELKSALESAGIPIAGVHKDGSTGRARRRTKV